MEEIKQYELVVDIPLSTPAHNYIAKKGQVVTYFYHMQFRAIYIQASAGEYSFNAGLVENNPQWFKEIK